ncbi:MAG: serine hydrolase [Bryobacteraceae bacterium]
MKTRSAVFSLLLAAFVYAQDTAEIESILANRVDESKKAVGLVIGTIDAKGPRVTGRGKRALDRDGKPDGDTVFEIGSITKVFTSLLLADMVERGELKADDPIAKFLPPTVKVPSRDGRQITLLDLSTQVSGLPRLPAGFKPADPANPYADYDARKLYEFPSGHTLARTPGEKYEYSNLGVGLLGHVLALKAGMSYEELLRRRIFEPLEMKSSSIQLSVSQQERLASGHDQLLKPVRNWDMDVLAGAGAIRSTANDMLKFAAANLELTDSPLKAAMRRMRSIRRETGTPGMSIAMGWHVLTKFGTAMVWHNGGTAGYRSFLGIVPENKQGVVVLCNTFLDNDAVGFHLLESKMPVSKLTASRERKEIAVDPKILETYVGEYEFVPAFVLTVTRDGARLFGQATGQPKLELFAESETEFFVKVVDAQISFLKDGLILHQMGRDQKARKK